MSFRILWLGGEEKQGGTGGLYVHGGTDKRTPVRLHIVEGEQQSRRSPPGARGAEGRRGRRRSQGVWDPSERWRGRRGGPGTLLPAVPLQDDRRVGAAEAEGVAGAVFEVDLAGRVGDEVEVAPLARLVEVDGRRQDLVTHGEGQDAGLQTSGRSQQVAGAGLRGGDR